MANLHQIFRDYGEVLASLKKHILNFKTLTILPRWGTKWWTIYANDKIVPGSHVILSNILSSSQLVFILCCHKVCQNKLTNEFLSAS